MAEASEKTFLRRHIITLLLSIIIVLIGFINKLQQTAAEARITVVEENGKQIGKKIDYYDSMFTVLYEQKKQDAELRGLLITTIEKLNEEKP